MATNIALCRACKKTSAFSDLVRDVERVGPDLSSPPAGAWFERTSDGFKTGAETRSWAALMLIPFTCVWAGGSLGGIYGRQIISGKLDLFSSLLGIPFFFGSCVLITMCVMSVAGKTEVIVTGDQLTVFSGVGAVGWTRQRVWSDFSSVREDTRPGGRGQQVLLLEGRRRIGFGTAWSEDRRYFVRSVLEAMLSETRRQQSIR